MKNIKKRILGIAAIVGLGIATNKLLTSKEDISYKRNYVFKYDCELMEKFNQEYNKDPERKEYLLCLEGKIQNDTIYLTGFHDPLYQVKKIGKVNYFPCLNAIGDLHPHYASYNCQPSKADKRSSKILGTKVKLIQCGESYIHGWVNRNWEKTYKLK